MKLPITAAILYREGDPLQIRTIYHNRLLNGQVLVKILYSGVCRSQLMEVRGLRGKDEWIPHLLGHEGLGIVESVGKGVTKVKKGDEVILSWIAGEGMEAPGATYKCDNGEIINSGKVTTFSNYSVVSENRVTIKPHGLSSKIAVLYGCALPTGAGMVLNELNLKKQSSIIIYGLGGIGISALIATKALGLREIIAIDNSEIKLNYAREIGIKHVFNSNSNHLFEKIRDITNGGADYCIESCGLTKTIEHAFNLINEYSGQLFFASHPAESSKIEINPHDLIKGKKIFGSWGGSSNPDRDFPLFHELLKSEDSSDNLEKLITKEYSLNEINQALNDLESGQVFRPIIEMNH